MKFSQNPITGIVEAYTDDGEFICRVYATGDEMTHKMVGRRPRTVDHAYMRRTVDRAAKRLNKNSKNGRR